MTSQLIHGRPYLDSVLSDLPVFPPSDWPWESSLPVRVLQSPTLSS